MSLTEALKKADADIKITENFIEANFKEKNDFIKHKIKLNNLNINFDNEKECFLLNEQNKQELEKFLKILETRTTIIFDMDGVIVNTTNSFSVATIKTYKHFTGLDLTSEEINEIKYKGGFNSDWDILMYYFEKVGCKTTFEEMGKYYMDLYFDGKGGLIDVETPILTESHVRELLKHYNLSVFTGRDTSSAMYTLKKWNIAEYFYPIITFECVGIDHQKPDIKGVNLIKEKVIADEIYYLGDTVDDMICARNANVNGIGVLPPRDKSDRLKVRLLEEGAITCLDTTTDVYSFLSQHRDLITKM